MNYFKLSVLVELLVASLFMACSGGLVDDLGRDAADAGDTADVGDSVDAGGDLGDLDTAPLFYGPTEIWVLEGSEGHAEFQLDEGDHPREDSQLIRISLVSSSDEQLLPSEGIELRCEDSGDGCSGHLRIEPAAGESGRGIVHLEISDGGQSTTVSLVVLVEATVDASSARYVSPDADGQGNGSAALPWTMAQANAGATAGDTVLILPGKYHTGVAPQRDGTAADPIRFVAAERRRAIIDDGGSHKYLLTLDSRKHIQVHGLRFESSGDTSLATMNNASSVSIADTTILGVSVFKGGVVSIRDSKSVDFSNSRFERAFQNLLFIENTVGMRMQGMVIARGGHTPMFVSNGVERMIVRGSTFLGGWGRAGGFSRGPAGLLFERNVISGSIAGHRSAGAGFKVMGAGAIYRYNRLHDNGPRGFVIRDHREDVRIDHMRLYGNVIHNNIAEAFWLDTKGLGVYRDIAFQNNVFLDNDHYGVNYHLRGSRVDNQIRLTGNLFHHTSGQAPDPTEVVGCADDGNLWVAPNYLHAERHCYLRLDAASPLPEGGTPLTKTSAAGQGRDIPVRDAWWAFDGFATKGESGDLIQLGSERARLVAADRSKGLLSVDRDLSWDADTAVSLAWEGQAPSLGCFEAGGGLEHLGILSSTGSARSHEVVRFELVGAPADARVVWHLGDGTRATGLVIEHAYTGAEGRYGVRAYVHGGESWQRAATMLMLSNRLPDDPLVLLDFSRDDDVAQIKSDSWSRPLPNVRRVDAPRGKAIRIEISASDGGLESHFTPIQGWDIDAYPFLVLSYRIDSKIELNFSLEAFSNTSSVEPRLVGVGGTRGGAVTLHADGDWHQLPIEVSIIRDTFPDVNYLRGVRFTGPKGQGVSKGYEFDLLCVSANEKCE